MVRGRKSTFFPSTLVDSQLGLCNNTRQINKRKALKLPIVPPSRHGPTFLSVKLGNPFLANSFSSPTLPRLCFYLLSTSGFCTKLSSADQTLQTLFWRTSEIPCPPVLLSPHQLACRLSPMALPLLPHFLKLSPHSLDSSLWKIFSSPNASVAPKC